MTTITTRHANEALARALDIAAKTSRAWQQHSPAKDRDYSHWSKRKDRFYPINATHDVLPSGIYEIQRDSEANVYSRKITFPTDELLVIPGTPVDFVLKQIDHFYSKREVFEKFGLIFKRGILFYGPAGCGKTSIIRMLASRIVEKYDGIVISISDVLNAQDFILKLREVEPERPIMNIFEDIEKMAENPEDASDMLSFLDGEKQINNVVNIATTNKPDVLEDRLLRRPGRFDLVIGLNPPIKEARRIYLERLFTNSVPPELFERIVEETDGLGLAHLREIAVSLLCFDSSFDEIIKRLKGNIKHVFKMPTLGHKVDTGFTLGFKE